MTTRLWHELLARYEGVPRCDETGETENLSVDHLQPRYLGGEDKADNLRFLTARLNAVKGTRPDKYWSQAFYFDQVPNLDAMRTAQRDGYTAILDRREWFSRPFSDIARYLYCFCWVVGAGKTLATLTTACAMNSILCARYGAGYARRADRILVLTKERAIRDQIADDLKKDPARFGLLPIPPDVAIIENGSQWADRLFLDGKHVIVACIQQLWGDDGYRPEHFHRILHEFPLIFIDEPHYAWQRVLNIVEAASTSICFGFTGMPTNKFAMPLLDRMVAINIHGYQEADEKDYSMKLLTDAPDVCVRTLAITEAEALKRGQLETINDANEHWYMMNIEPAKSVVREVIREMKKRDALTLSMPAAHHRLDLDHKVALLYSSHGMIAVPNVEFANILCESANQMFTSKAAEYPKEEGWHAEVVHSEGIEAGGEKRPHKPLSPDHPWLRAKRLPNLRADRSCSRLLFVIGMGREGVNNPLCGPIGVCTATESHIEAVQRWIGRQIRAVVKLHESSLLVPPADLDQVLIITHETFNIGDLIKDAINFTLNMQDQLASMKTVRTLEDEEEPPTIKPTSSTVPLSSTVKVQIAGILGGGADDVPELPRLPRNDPAGLENAIVNWVAPNGQRNPSNPDPKVKQVKDWIKLVQTSPKEAGDQLGINRNRLETIYTVWHEEIEDNPNDDQLRSFLRCFYKNLENIDLTLGQQRDAIRALYASHAERSRLPRLSARHSIQGIRKLIWHDIQRKVRGHYKPPQRPNGRPDESLFYKSAGQAIKDILGVPVSEQAADDSKWDNPYTHALLMRPEVRKDIEDYVIGQLILDGQCPALKALRR
jgi:hypothetical protein